MLSVSGVISVRNQPLLLPSRRSRTPSDELTRLLRAQVSQRALLHHLKLKPALRLGVVDNKTAFEYPVDELQWLFGINVFGAFYCAREAAKHMVGQGGGSITLVGSMSGTVRGAFMQLT